MKKSVTVVPGEIYAIPLFVSELSALTTFSKRDWDRPDARFAFMRVIEDRVGAGIVIEVLNHVGGLDAAIADVARAKRLFRPVAISGLAISKKRWPRLGQQANYDRERDSGYSEISLVLAGIHRPVLWTGGRETPISPEEASRYEPWTLWNPAQLERRIIEALEAARKD
jgi:pimeloyl-ACP methyl ester carboxylesterase